ncbi:hypothetical protein [uncultured Oscillibacter sp.]|uniref:hypothetical protein n=1 Tax=uncultured Oscillibacter sp. TaxID=876091 RepID=UPI00263131AC|nr:hypothetical protein [uncultured Oscillibacter sp.]
MADKILLPGLDEPQTLEAFCRAYLSYRSEVEAEALRLEQAAREKRALLEAAQKDAEALPAEIKRVKADIRRVKGELAGLQERGRALSEDGGDGEEAAREEEERRRLLAEYEEGIRRLEEESRRFRQSQEQSGAFMETLRAYQALAGETEPFRELAEHNVSVICQCFPTAVPKITGWMSLPVDMVEEDIQSRLPARREMEGAVIVRPLQTAKLIDAMMVPDSCTSSLWRRGELVFWQRALALLLLAGVAGSVLLSPWCVPAAVLLALASAVVLNRRRNRTIEGLVPWDELRLYRFILNYTLEDAERLARESHGLPAQSSEEYAAAHQELLSGLSRKRSELETLAARERGALDQARQDCGALEREQKGLSAKAGRKDSRLGYALQKRKNGLELTANETMLLNEYEASQVKLRERMSAAEDRVAQSQDRLTRLEEELTRIAGEVRRQKDSYEQTHSRLSQIEAVRGDAGSQIEARRAALMEERAQALEQLQKDQALRRERRREERQRKAQETQAGIGRELQSREASLNTLTRRLEELERLSRADQLAPLREESRSAARQAEERRALAGALCTAEVWQENCAAWFQASQELLSRPPESFAIRSAAYVMGPSGPYRLEHGCHPCVLLYDAPGEGQESRPSYYLEKTVKAIMFGLRYSSAPGLVEFAVVDEYGNGGRAGEAAGKCYGSPDLEELNRLVDRWIQELRQETKGHTVSAFNQAQAQYLLENRIVSGPEEVVGQMRKTLFVFVMPQMTARDRPLNHPDLWRKLRDDCGDFGFVPLLLIPKGDWESALSDKRGGTAFAAAVRDELNSLTHIQKIEIPLN